MIYIRYLIFILCINNSEFLINIQNHSNLKKNQIRKIRQVEFTIIFMSFFVFAWKNKKFQTINRPVFRLGFQTKIVKRNSSINVTVEYRLRFSFSFTFAHKVRSYTQNAIIMCIFLRCCYFLIYDCNIKLIHQGLR